jgi:pimeloyl-ACP methyl ester carboxylesterase
MNENTGKHAAVNGLEMYYEIHGEGEPLILLHGGVGAIEMFGEVLPLLALRHLLKRWLPPSRCSWTRRSHEESGARIEGRRRPGAAG